MPLDVALVVGLPVLLIVALGKATRRTPPEIAAVILVTAGVTFLLALFLVTYGPSHADLN